MGSLAAYRPARRVRRSRRPTEAGDLGGTIFFHPEWWYPLAVELELPQPDGSVVYRQIKPEPQHEITLLLEHLKKDGTVSFARGRRIAWGASPRGSIALERCARARAWLAGRDFVTPDDVHAVAPDVLRHRVLPSYEATAEGWDGDRLVAGLLEKVPLP